MHYVGRDGSMVTYGVLLINMSIVGRRATAAMTSKADCIGYRRRSLCIRRDVIVRKM